MRISDWSSDVCSSDLDHHHPVRIAAHQIARRDPRAADIDDAFHPLDLHAILAGAHPVILAEHRIAECPAEMHVAVDAIDHGPGDTTPRSEEHTSELQSLMRISYAVFCLKQKKKVKI